MNANLRTGLAVGLTIGLWGGCGGLIVAALVLRS